LQFVNYCKRFYKTEKKATFAKYFGAFWKVLKGKNKGWLSERRKNKKCKLKLAKKIE
jgi:hypothetical protein